jgi:antitoxin component of RelBE/YafQ-DinJ toxin-antitoxin module
VEVVAARSRIVCFRVEEEVWERFKKLTYSYGLRPSQLLRMLVRSAVSTAEPRKRGGGPKDDSAL